MKFLLLMLLTPLMVAQSKQMFIVTNPDKHYSEIEAIKAYKQAIDVVADEYHLLDRPMPQFELIFQDDKAPGIFFPEAKTWTGAKLYLKKWDVRYFREGVIGLAINELMRPENFARLELRIERQQAATVNVETLKK